MEPSFSVFLKHSLEQTLKRATVGPPGTAEHPRCSGPMWPNLSLDERAARSCTPLSTVDAVKCIPMVIPENPRALHDASLAIKNGGHVKGGPGSGHLRHGLQRGRLLREVSKLIGASVGDVPSTSRRSRKMVSSTGRYTMHTSQCVAGALYSSGGLVPTERVRRGVDSLDTRCGRACWAGTEDPWHSIDAAGGYLQHSPIAQHGR